MNEGLKKYVVTGVPDLSSAEKLGFPCVHLLYKISEDGTLKRAQSQFIQSRKSLMGIYDGGGFNDISAEKLCRDIISEMTRRGYSGVLLDFSAGPNISKLEDLCFLLSSKNIVYFLPLELANLSPDAKIIIPASVSGGSVDEMLTAFTFKYEFKRLCVQIEKGCNDFLMPSYKPDGTHISSERLNEIYEKYTPSAYFSDKLGCKYFTYRENGNTHFVLFDDAETATYKINLAESKGYYAAFIEYSDWRDGIKYIL